MTRPSTHIILTIVSILFIVACGQTTNKGNVSTNNQVVKHTRELIQIDFKDSNYLELQLYVKDTTTNDGWAIKYLVKDDSTKYKNIYIECSKGNFSGTFQGSDLLQFRRYFIPVFLEETNSFIYFTHGCATDCSALLVFTKDSTSRFKDYQSIVDYDIDLNQLLYVTDSSYENEDKIYDLALVDLINDKTHKITYNNICSAVYKPTCIDTVIFNKTKMTITTTLRKGIGSEQEIKQTRTIKL